MRWFYAKGYNYGFGLPFKDIHGFILNKPLQIRAHLLDQGVAELKDFIVPKALTEQDFSKIYTSDFLQLLQDKVALARSLELAWLSILPLFWIRKMVVLPQLLASGGTCEAIFAAAEGEWSINLSGGFHHARPLLSHGFCLVNDVAYAVDALRRSGQQARIVVLDTDLHQGDGNSVFFKDAKDVMTVSLHQESAFPFPKMKSDLDLGLPAGIEDDDYMKALDQALDSVREFSPDIIIYLAGTDIYYADQIGQFSITEEGIGLRERKVALCAQQIGAALVTLPAGGYSNESPKLAAKGFAEIAKIAL